MLLAVQQILHCRSGESDLLLSAMLLEAGIQYSPHNAYLKITAMFVYAQLNAVHRSWELYQDLAIKHIQNESCAYLILPLLRRGAFYIEVIQVCQDIMRLQLAAAREVVEFSGRALENGALSKADEFVAFHKQRMNRSLTTLEARGLILNCAPMYHQNDNRQPVLGDVQGIVGGDEDMDRVVKIVSEAHNPIAAFGLLQMDGVLQDYVDLYSDNRDFSILMKDILVKREFESKEDIIADSLRRGLQHNLLIRAALCLDATKGLKKGKPVKCSDELQRRCASLVSVVEGAYSSVNEQSTAMQPMLMALMHLCQAMVVVGGGFDLQSKTCDSALAAREATSSGLLRKTAVTLQEYQASMDLATLAQVSVAISDSFVPVFVLFRMCGKVMELFGWGRKKRHAKDCADAMADVALALLSMVNDLADCTRR
jgi:N-acetyltransferase B complex (NatB) non catalytic subunit